MMEATWLSTAEMIGHWATAGTFLFAVFVSVFLYRDFAPVVLLRITPRWTDNGNAVILRLEVENRSRVPLRDAKFYLNVIYHDTSTLSELTEFVTPANLTQIFTTTQRIWPGETVAGDRLYKCPTHQMLQVLLQVKAIPRGLWLGGKSWGTSWSTTAIVVRSELELS
jgi:hypothetical protein